MKQSTTFFMFMNQPTIFRYFRSLNEDIKTIINKSEAVKKAKKESENLTPKEKKELSDEEKEYKSKRKMIQEKLIKFATRVPVFMYLTDYREYNSIQRGTKMKKIIALLACFMCLITFASAESLTLEERIAALEARIATLEELLRALTEAPTKNEDINIPTFTPGQNNPQYAEDAIWYHDAEKGIILECTDFYYNDTNRGEILWKFTVRNGSEHKVKFSAQNVYINGWLHSTAISTAAMDELAPNSNMKDFIMLTDLLKGSIDGIETLDDIGRVQEIRFELVVRIDGREVERIPVIITDMSTLEEREGW